MLKPENYSDVQRAMEERLNIPQSSDIRQSIISATEKIVHNKTARFFENSDMSEAEKNNFRKLISDATAYEVCKSCGFKTEDMPELFSDNIYVDMADAISATVSGISSIIMQSIENNVRISDERIRNERENNNGNITAESYERTGADASSNNRGRTDSGIDPRRTNEVGRAETSGTAAINADNAYSRGSDGNQNTADENAASIYNRTLRTDEVRVSGTADAEAPGVSDREQAAERTPGTSAGERGNRVQEIYPQSGNAGRGMAESNRNGQLHNEEPIVQQLPNDSRGRTDESLDLHRTRGNGIIGKATFKYIRDKKYVKGNTDDMLKVAARLDAENISFSGRINDDTTTITVSGAELQNKVRQYLDEVQHSSNLRRFEKDSFTEKEMDKQKDNSPVGNVIPETPKESLLRIAFNEYNDFVNSITTTAEAVEKANEITIKQELLRYFGELEEVEAAAILGTSDKPLEMVYGEWVRNGYNSLSDDVSATLTGIVRKSENAEKEHQISEVGNVFELAENYEIVFSVAEFEDGTRHIFPGAITEEDVWNSDVWNEVRNRNVDYDNITDLDESFKVRITHCTYGRGNTLTPNQDILNEIDKNFNEIRSNSQVLSIEETYLYLYKDIDDVLSELEKVAQEQHQREPQVSDGFDNSNFLLPDNLSPIARSGGREYYQIDEAVKAIKLNDREWLNTFDAVVAMNKKGVNVNDIEMLNVHYISADGSTGYKDITPEQYIVYRNHTEERPQQMKAALKRFVHFADDAEKMVDFKLLSKEEFLESYSYLSVAEYDATAEHLINEKMEQYLKNELPNVIRRIHAHDEMEDLVKETATDQFNDIEYQNKIARKYIGNGTINFPDRIFEDVKKELETLGLDADNFSVKIICTVDNVTLENTDMSVTYSWDEVASACLTAAEIYSNGENNYVINTIAHFIEEEKIKKAIADKGDIHFNAGNDNYIIAYDKEEESYFLEVKRPHSTDYERLREMHIETSDDIYGVMIWNSGKITGFSKDYSTDVDIPRDEFIEWAVKNLASMPYIQNAHNDEAKFRHLVRDNLYTLLYEYATGSENFNDYSIADFEKFFNKYINDAAELESIIYVVHNDVNENVLRIEKAKEVAEKADLPFSSRLIDGDEDFDPYVYDGTMSLEDVEKMHELIAEDKFEIYQIKSGEEYRDKRFTDYNSLSASPALEDYDLVYSGLMSELGVSNLEEIYAKFNLNHPEDFTGHSLSVSDIIVLHNEGDKYYYVDSVGYKDVTDVILDREQSIEEKFPNGELEQEEQTSLFNDAPGRISSDEINLSDFDDVVDEPISEKEIPGGITVTCEWSESNVFEGGKMYTVAEFDRLMAAADSEKTEGWENGIEEYGSAEAFEQMDKERYYKYLGYEKTRFTINFPNGTTISERQDIGDGFGGLISYCKTFPSLQQYVPFLEAQRDLDNLKSGYVEENKNSPMGNNFKITDDFSIDSGAKTRFRNNVEAIKLLNTIEAENRLATPDEQKILAKYVGWGGLSKAFDATDANWQREYNELKELLTESEYNSARGSVLNAHYTTATVINAIYQGLENLGFEGGRILEPAMGTGNFFGAMPQNMADNSQLVGVELDGITGRIAKQLYQNADIQVTGFEKTKFADNSFDVAVGNVPFGAYKLMDKKYDKENFYIHDYFFAKALDKVKPGGVVAFVTSKGTLDKQNPEVRKYLAQRAELVGAIRLPNNAFKANAGTEVTTDIIFLQKRDRMIDIEPDWVHLGMTENGLAINKYFIDHPEMVLGTIVEGNKLYGNQSNETMCVPIEGADLGEQLAEAVKNIKGQITGERTVDEAEKEDERAISATPGVGFYRYAVVDGNIYYRMNGDMMYPVDKPQQKDRTIAMVELRDTVHKLLDAEMDNANNRNATEISILRKTLNKQYDNFAEKYGRITSKVNKKAFENDNSYHLLASLEKYDSDNNYIGKADIFEKSTVKPRIVTEHVDTAADALILSVSEKAKVDFEYMQQLTDMDKDTLIQELGNKIYQIPNSDKWVTADEYLSGNIRKKLAEAKAAGMEVNIQALEMAMPPTIDAADIDAKLGAAWIKPEYVQQFIVELLDPPHNTRKKIDVVYSEYGDKWKIEGYKSNYYNSNVTEIYGIPEYNAYEIIEQTLNMKSVEVRKTLRDERGFPKLDKNGNEIRVIDAEKTAIVQSKQKEIKRKFAEWAFKDPDRRNNLVRTFNERFNSVRLREFDGSNLNFVGMNSEIKLRKHQVDAVARQLYNGNTLLAHEVGAGKTFEMIAAAMEGKRLGLHNKSMFAVPNHLTEQFATDFRKLYPNCNILVATKKDMDTQHRRDFMAKIATGDYDAVILGHSQFDRIHLSPELESEYIQDELKDLRKALEDAKANAAYREKSFSVKQIELAIKSREQQLERTKAKIGDDNVISFERLGIDKLFVDESHAYKNLDIATKMTRVAGLGGKGSGRSLGLLMKCKYLNEKTDFKGITFASGTPVSNSMTELYTIMRYLEPQKMADAGIRTFDNWASVFAETEQSNELKPECDGKFQTKTRISKYSCFEQLMTMYGEVADVKTAEMMKLPRPESAVEVIKAPATRAVLREMRKLSSRASEIRKGEVDPKVDNMLKLTLDGKKIGLDLRLMNPYAKDDPNSKVNLCIKKVMDIYKETTPTSGVQMIFCDLSTPKKENPNSYAIYKKDAFGDYQLAYTTGLKKTDTFESLQKKFSNGKSLPKDYDKETYGKLDADDVIVLHTTDENGNVTNTAQYITSENTLEIASDGLYEEIGVTPYVSADELTKQFCVYEDIKEKLIKNGVPEEEIAFIHDYDKPEDKQKLYNQMNEGKVRVMIGSTGKCGAGMNAQKKMIALHHLDVPARPSDIEQRNGRIQRQGNENENVRIFRYITDRTFDAYSYQILENKQKFISQIMSGEIRVKTCEDIDEKALDYAEVKALCAGNPMIKEKIDLETQVNELRILKAAFDRQKYDLQDKALRTLPQDISSTELTINAIQTDIQTLNMQTKAIDDEGKEYYPITFNGTTYSSKEDAGNALKACMLQAIDGKEVRCGTYRGFDISVVYDTFGKDFKAVIRGAKKYYCPLNADPNVHASGNIRRLDNALGNIEKVLEEQYSKLENLKTSLEIAKNSADEEFPQLAELHEKENRLSEVEQQLQLSEAVDTTINVDLYAQLTELFPTIMSKQDSYVKLEAGEAFDSLNVQWISEKEIAVSHTYEQNGDLMYDPEIVFQVDATQLTATAISYEQSNMGKYETYETLAEAADCNTFASEWFDNIEQQGYEPVEQKSFDEEIDKEPVRDDNVR